MKGGTFFVSVPDDFYDDEVLEIIQAEYKSVRYDQRG